MGDMLSQAEIDALLGGSPDSNNEPEQNAQAESNTDVNYTSHDDEISGEEKDVLGEVGNISMGTSATTLFALLGQKVTIDTPKVHVVEWQELGKSYERPCVGVRVDYKEGLKGSNILILKQSDVKIITNLMMGGTGEVGDDIELNEIDLSAIGEAMNQMVGSSSTSLSSLTKMKIDIDTPKAFILDFKNDDFFAQVGFLPEDIVVATSFRMKIGNLIDSNIMQILPIEFAKDIVTKLTQENLSPPQQSIVRPQPEQPVQEPFVQQQQQPQQQAMQQAPAQQQTQQAPPPPPAQQPYPDAQQYGYPPQYQYQYAPPPPQPQQNINVQPATFAPFDVQAVMQQKENIDIIMDVPLEVTVELGRTRKKIKEILEFAPGTVIELDKLAGEPIDILVNGKFVAKGEVVVIDENFGIRISDIINPENRI